MPLTFAHPAAVLPLTRLRLPFSALVVGSMAPDFVYFVRWAPRGHFGHTFPGLFLFCLPAGLAVLWVFHRLIKRPLLAISPLAVQRRVAPVVRPFAFWTSSRLLLVLGSILLGAVTHILWDAFTHEGGWGVTLIPVLQHSVAVQSIGKIRAYKLAQHGSTLFGLVALGIWLRHWWRTAAQAEVSPQFAAAERLRRAWCLAGLALLIGAVYAASVAARTPNAAAIFAGHFVIAVTSSGFLLAAVYGLWMAYRNDARAAG